MKLFLFRKICFLSACIFLVVGPLQAFETPNIPEDAVSGIGWYNGTAWVPFDIVSATYESATTEQVTPVSSSSAAIQSNGSGGGNWNLASTWLGGIVPTSADNATIKAGDVVELHAFFDTGNFLELNIEATGTLSLLNGTALNGTNGITNNGTITSGATINNTTHQVQDNITNNLGGVINWGGYFINGNGNTITNHGTLNFNTGNPFTGFTVINENGGQVNRAIAGNMNFPGAFINNAGGTLTVASGSGIIFTDSLSNKGTVDVSGVLMLNSGSHYFEGGTFGGSGYLEINGITSVTSPTSFTPAFDTITQTTLGITSSLTGLAGSTMTIPANTYYKTYDNSTITGFSTVTNEGKIDLNFRFNNNTNRIESDVTNNGTFEINGFFTAGRADTTIITNNNMLVFNTGNAITNICFVNNAAGNIVNNANRTLPCLTDNSLQCNENEYISTLYGTGIRGYTGDDNAATTAQFGFPNDLAFDASGNLFVLDAANHVVRKVDATTGNISTIAGTGVSGFAGDGGQATAAQFNFPRAIAVDANGDLFVADANNNRIRKIDLSTGVITTIAGNGDNFSGGDGGPATSAGIFFPAGIVFNSLGELFITDSNNNAIRKVDISGIIQTVASGFSLPQQLGIDASNNLYISDFLNRQIKKLDAANGFAISVIAGTGTAGYTGDGGQATAAQISIGQGGKIIVDAGGDLYFADVSNHVIRRIDANTGIITTIAGTGTAGYSGDNGLATQANLNTPSSIAFNAAGELLIADSNNDVIRVVGCQTSCTVAIDSLMISYGDCLVEGNSQVTVTATCDNCVIEYAIDGINFQSGNVFTNLKDSTYTITVREQANTSCTSAGKITLDQDLDVIPPTVVCRDLDLTVNLDASGMATITPSQVDSGSTDNCSDVGNLSFSLSQSAFDCEDLSGQTGTPCVEVSTFVGTPYISGNTNGTDSTALLNFPRDVVVDTMGNIFVTDERNHVIRKITPAGVVTTFAGMMSVSGSQNGTGTAASFNHPSGLAIDGAGNLYVGDTRNSTIRKITSAGVVTTFAGTVGVNGSADGTGINATFGAVRGITVDKQGNVYTCGFSRKVRKITPAGVVTTIAGMSGSSGTQDGNGINATFNLPLGIAIDDNDNLYVTDILESVIRKITPNGDVTTFAGQVGVTGAADGMGTNATFNFLVGLAIHDGILYVADQGSGLVRQVTLAGEVTTLAGIAGVKDVKDGTSKDATFSGPFGIAVDTSNGNIYTAEISAHVIRKIEVIPNCLTTTLTVTDELGNSASCVAQVQLNDPNNACQPAMATALDFDGTDDFVDLGVWNPFSSTGFTQEAWVYADNIGPDNWSNSILIQEGSGGTSTILRAGAGDNVRASYHHAGGIYDLDGTITTNQWHHLAMAWDGSTFALYIDGTLAQSIPATNPPSQTSSNLYIGNSQVEHRIWDGRIDEVRIWGRGLCQDEIQSRMNCELVGDETDLLAYYSFNQGITLSDNALVSTLIDSSANNNHGTLTNFSLDGNASNWTDGTDNGVSGDCGVASCCDLAITTQPMNQEVCDGEDVTFSVAATSSVGNLTYQWQKSCGSIANAWTRYNTFTGPSGLPNNRVRGIYESGGVMYAATESGVATLDVANGATNWTVYNMTTGPSGFPSNDVREVFYDNGIIYAATRPNSGFATLDVANGATSWTVHDIPSGTGNFKAVYDVFVHDGVVYVATAGGDFNSGLYTMNVGDGANSWIAYGPSTPNTSGFPNTSNVYGVHVTGGVIYIATFGGGIASLDIGNNATNWTVYNMTTGPSSFPSNNVYEVYAENGVIYAATTAGLAVLDVANGAISWTVHNTTSNSNFPNNTVYDLSASNGIIYAATGGGVATLDVANSATSWIVYTSATTEPSNLPTNTIYSIHVSNGKIHVGTNIWGIATLEIGGNYENLIGETQATLNLTPQNGEEACTYQVVITDANNCEIISDAVSFTNSGASPDIAAISTQTNNCPSETVDLSSLTITDNNTVTGTATTFHSAMPISAADMTSQLGTTTISADQTVFVMIANSTTGCFDVASFMVDITTCNTGVCDPNALVLNDNPIAANTYHTAQTITSNGTVAASTTVAFKAAQTITLQAGFHAVAGSDFIAVIEACPATLVESETAKVIDQPSTQLATTSEIIGTPSVKVFPNPTTYRASIDLTLPVAETVQLDLFDLSGKRVANLVKDVILPAGIHHFEWQCEQVDAGMYLLVLNGQVVSKLAVIR